MASAFLLAGESSGDLQGALLARELKRAQPDLQLHGVGGERMAAAGVDLLFRSDELAVVGLVEVLSVLPRILGAMERIREFLSSHRPDVFVPIDFPDFNLRLLPHAWRIGIPIVYYIGPQVWAWRRGRLDFLRRYVSLMIVIFPFEEQLYRDHGIPVEFVGHPLVDHIPEDRAELRREVRNRHGIAEDEAVIALLPGSRRSEVARVAPILRRAKEILDRPGAPEVGRTEVGRTEEARAGAARPEGARSGAARSEKARTESARPDGVTRKGPPTEGARPRWIVGQARGLSLDTGALLGCRPDVPREDGFAALAAADLAWVASGTATLEALLLATPSIVVYRVQWATYEIAKRVIQVPHIAMANLIAGRRLLPELIQDEAEPATLAELTRDWLRRPEERGRIREGLEDARHSLGPAGAAGRAARLVLERIGCEAETP